MLAPLPIAAGLATILLSFLAPTQEPAPPPAPRWRSAAQASERGWVVKLEGERLLVCGAESCSWLEDGDPRWRRGADGVEVDESAIAALLDSAGETARAKAARGPGDLLPELVLVDLADRPILLGGYRGKRLLITAWASW